jgi:hypothetical protein
MSFSICLDKQFALSHTGLAISLSEFCPVHLRSANTIGLKDIIILYMIIRIAIDFWHTI